MPIPTFNALRRYAVFGFMACAASWVPLASAQPATPVVVMDSTTFDFYSSYPFDTTQWRGPAFTTGAVDTRITEVTFGLNNNVPGDEATLRLFQLDDATELPTGSALASASLQIVYSADGANLSANTYTAAQLGTIPTTTLQANKKYALIFSNATNAPMALSDYNIGNAYTYGGGFSVAASGYVETLDSGATWTVNDSVTPAIKLTVVPLADVVPPTATLACTPTELLAVAGQVSTCTVTLSTPSTTDTPINLTLPATNPGYTTTCTSPLVVPANATQASCTITAVANTTPGAPDVIADIAIAPPTTPDAYTVEGPAAQITIRSSDTGVPPVTAPTPVPTLGTVGLVSLVSVMGLLGLRRTRKTS